MFSIDFLHTRSILDFLTSRERKIRFRHKPARIVIPICLVLIDRIVFKNIFRSENIVLFNHSSTNPFWGVEHLLFHSSFLPYPERQILLRSTPSFVVEPVTVRRHALNSQKLIRILCAKLFTLLVHKRPGNHVRLGSFAADSR